MGKIFDGIVVENNLFAEYHKFRSGQPCDTKIIRQLLHYHCREIISNIRQYAETGIELETNLKSQMAHAGLRKQSLEELAENHTLYKIILSTSKNHFPYINIMDNSLRLERNFSASFDIDESRSFAIKHLKAICLHAKEITIYDKYISNNISNIDILKEILPKKNLTITYTEIEDSFISELASKCSDWKFIKNVCIRNRHDRYIVIDKMLEVILSSGFDHLNNTARDFTYLIRPVKNSRFAKG